MKGGCLSGDFPEAEGKSFMSQHPGSLIIERVVPAEEAAPGLVHAPRAQSPGEIDAAPAGSGRRLRKLLLIGAGLAVLAGAAYLGERYWTAWRFEIATDDAYVKADNTTIAPKISGYLGAVLVGDNERVKAGQVLARIDDRDYQVALEQAKADVSAAQATLRTRRAALDTQQSIIAAARATIDVDQASLAFAEQDDKRYSSLAATGYGSVQNAQQASSHIAAARAAVVRDKATLETATRQVDVLSAEIGQAEAALAHSVAAERQAQLNLSYAMIVSPIDGVVGARTLRVGQYVQAGTQLMAVVPLDGAYIVANYKETQLTDVRPGQPAEIEVDTYPGVAFKGHVDSLAPASGQEFALLPPDNATGNFTKVVQRIPVKIVLDAGSPLPGALRPGMSVYPTIDTKADAGKSSYSTLVRN
jgi:membrane fusion protein, multidrug efflux system